MTKSKASVEFPAIIFTCIGRRVSLLNSFRKAAGSLKLKYSFLGTDMTPLSPALQLCDAKFVVPRVTETDYIKHLISIVKKNSVRLLIPTVDLDLRVLALNKHKFESLGCRVLVSDPEVIDICQDKIKTYRFLTKNSLPSPETMTVRTALSRKKLPWPCFIKPRDGYASRGSAVVGNRNDLKFLARTVPNAIVQHLIEGIEHTCDVYVDLHMNPRCVVPRRRIEVRSGEVSKSMTVKNHTMMEQAGEVVRRLRAGPGVITLQLFETPTGKISFIEVNPRFGGGVPLSIKAGADFPKWILQELNGRKPRITSDGFKDNLAMLRYDAEVWLENPQIDRKGC